MGRRRSEPSSPSGSSRDGSRHNRGYRSSRSRSRDERRHSPPPVRHSRRRESRSPEYRERRGRRADNPPPSKCIGIFGLSIYTDESTVRDIFSKFGPVKRIAMIHCPQVSDRDIK